MSQHLPSDTKLRWFSQAGSLGRRIVPEWIRRFLQNQLFGVTPNVPVTLLDLSADAPAIRALITGVVLAWVFCLGGVVAATWLSGTLTGNQAGRVFFEHDRANQINYAILCPAYVGLSAMFIVLTLQAWNRVRHAPLVNQDPHRAPRLPVAIFVLIIVGTSAAFTVRYVVEQLNPAIYERAGWWMSLDTDGRRVLNLAGIYYTLLNFCLLIISLWALAFVSVFACVAAEIGRALRSRAASEDLKFERLQKLLCEFTLAYIVVKLLAASYMVNAYLLEARTSGRVVQSEAVDHGSHGLRRGSDFDAAVLRRE